MIPLNEPIWTEKTPANTPEMRKAQRFYKELPPDILDEILQEELGVTDANILKRHTTLGITRRLLKHGWILNKAQTTNLESLTANFAYDTKEVELEDQPETILVNTEDPTTEVTQEALDAPKVPKKRGRPKKIAAAMVHLDVHQPPKKRGRPKGAKDKKPRKRRAKKGEGLNLS